MIKIKSRFARSIYLKVGVLMLAVSTLCAGFINTSEATIYGDLVTGYQWIKKGSGGYGIYVPKSFDPNKEAILIFSFGRTEDDRELSREEIGAYTKIWTDEAEKRGAVVVCPYWQPVVISGHQNGEEYYLEILDEVTGMYDINPKNILLVGFGFGGVQAYSMGALYPERFHSITTIASSPLRDRIMKSVLSMRQWQKFRGHLLLVQGENDGTVPLTWVEEDKARLTQDGTQVELKLISNMVHEHDPKVNPIILDWFDGLKDKGSLP